RHLVAEYLRGGGHERIGKGIGGQAGAIKNAAGSLDILEHIGKLPAYALMIRDRLAEYRSIANISHCFVKCSLRQTQRNAWIEATLSVECGQQLAKAIFLDHQVLQWQFAIV